jgi:hypothetical protein
MQNGVCNIPEDTILQRSVCSAIGNIIVIVVTNSKLDFLIALISPTITSTADLLPSQQQSACQNRDLGLSRR